VSRLADERAALIAALEAVGLRVATTGKLTGPCILLEPGDPWSEPQRLPRRVGRWRLTAIAGAVDTEGGLLELAGMVDTVDLALRAVPGAQLPTWARPAVTEIEDGVRRRSAIATISYSST
jgi:hypothetical protein